MASLPVVKQKRNYLPLKKKVEVIKAIEKDHGLSHRALAERFECGRTQVAQIIKNKESIMAMFSANASGSKIHSFKVSRVCEFEEVNKALYEWYLLACSKNIYPGGPQLIEKAKVIAEQLGIENFKGSNGWLGKWKARYNVKRFKICGESGDVQGATVDSWKERLPELIGCYTKENVWNMDETGVFWRALPDSGFGQKGKECKGGKRSKQRITVAFFVNAAGGKEKPIVIWTSANPRCLKRFDKSVLPVNYYDQKKAWMTGDIMESVLTKLNSRLVHRQRSILLLMDNAKCHPSNLESKLTNIKIIFLPANTTSKLQPLDLGIIQNFNVHYKHFLLRYVLTKIDECQSAFEVAKSIDILIAIRWVAQAWAMVTGETIAKCFKKAGVLNSELEIVSCSIEDDPFAEADLVSLMKDVVPNCCSPEEYVNGEDSLPICNDLDSLTWEEDFMHQLLQEDRSEESDEGEEEDTAQLTVSRVKTYKDAIVALEDVQTFLDSRGHLEDSAKLGIALDSLATLHIASMKQKTLYDFFCKEQ